MIAPSRPAPKPPRAKAKRPRKLLRKVRMRCGAGSKRRKGRAFGASRVDREFMAWIGTLPCAVCLALNVVQFTPTEVEHFVLRSHGGYDRGDCYPTCSAHREMRHVVMGPKAFTRMLKARGFDERKLCDKLVMMYEAEVWPCP